MSEISFEINLNKEYKIKIEKGNGFRKSIFSEVYYNALKNVIEIVKQSDINVDNPKYDDFNNIIAFTGERGKGKSSSMISFRDALINKCNDEHKDFFSIDKKQNINDRFNFFGEINNQKDYIDYDFLRTKSFAQIEVIDPSLFRGGESLLEIILAQMFQKFQEEIKELNCKINQEDKRIIIQNFQDVFQNLQIINSDRKELYKKESIEALSKLATSSNLKHDFEILINNYLNKFENKKDFLVITIDDFDLNIADAYDMLEDIRQFLILKRVILLIACKVEQLSDGIRNNIAKSVSVLFNNHIEKLDGFYIHDSLKALAFKYLEKLLPLNRRIILPTLRMDQKILLEINYNNQISIYSSIEDCILNLIYTKTKVFIPKNSEYQNLIIPSNLRGIIDIISFLFYIKNSEEFLNYFMLLKLEYLEGDDIKILNELNPGANIFNKFIISSLLNNDKTLRGYNYHIQHQLIGNVYDIYNTSSKDILSFTDPTQYKSIHYKIILYNIVNAIKFKNRNFSMNLNELFVSDGTIFPKDIRNNLYRDRFTYGNFSKITKNLGGVELLFLLSFTPFVFTENKAPIYNFFIDENYELACFNALSFINILIDPSSLYKRLIITNEQYKDSENLEKFYNDLMIFDKSDLILFTNVDFLQIFFEKLYQKTRYRRNDFASTIFGYIQQAVPAVLREINDEYLYLKINVENFEDNPLFKYWNENIEFVNNLFNKVFSGGVNRNNYSRQDIDTANYALNRYSKYFTLIGDYSARGAKQAINSLIKNFDFNNDIKSKLLNFRSLMDEDLEEGLYGIYELLKTIK